jgi:protein ImuB
MFACLYFPTMPDGVSLADFAYAFSPLLEETAVDTVVIDTEGCELIFGSAYELANEIANTALRPKGTGGLGCKINVAIAGNLDTAIYAARFFKGITFISPGEEITALGDLPVTELSPKSKVQSPKSKVSNSNKQTLDIGHWTLDEKKQHEEIQTILETLQLWGVHKFRDFANLPVTGVAERLGQLGVKLQQLASGKTKRHLKLKQAAPVFENSIELEYPLGELEPLSFIFARLLNQLCASLNAYALATNELRVRMKLEDKASHERTLNLPSPMCDHKVLLKLLLLDTEMHPPQAAVIAVSIAFEPVKPRVLQNGLFIPLAPQPEKLELTLTRLVKLLGPDNIGSPELVDTNRPGAFNVKRFTLKEKVNPRKHRGHRLSNRQSAIGNRQCLLGFRVFRPPLRAMVQADRGYPTQINAWRMNQSIHGNVVRLAGPWRTTGDWWRDDCWARDEWDVAVESRTDGTLSRSLLVLYRVYRELRNGLWFVEGIYD